MRRRDIFFFILVLIGGCTFFTNSKIVIKINGSETMLRLIKRLTQEYSKEVKNIEFIVNPGGTGAGVRSLVANETMISMVSRNLEPDEIKLVSEKYSTIGVSTLIAKDALCIYVNISNPINTLTMQEIRNIFLGNISNWKELGWVDKPINVYLRNSSSGTRQMFQNLVLENENFLNNSTDFNSITDLLKAVEDDIYSITFSGIDINTNCKLVPLENIFPIKENVYSGYYPLSRYLYFHTLNPPEGEIREFFNWVLSEKGQIIIEEENYFSLFDYKLD